MYAHLGISKWTSSPWLSDFMDRVKQLNAALSGRYEIDREIGAGGMATVYLARDLKHARHVALKILNPELGAVLGSDRFLAEINVTANLQHPNLLPLFDSGQADGLLYYVMPYVEGESLRARLEREKQLPVEEAVRIAIAIAGALDYAHRQGVIHRDLKPENILLHDGQPTIADFGIALAVSKAGGSRVTQTGLSLGTPQYMSPEQAAGDRAIDSRTDIYSLGAVTYEMLAGEPPHTGTSAQAIIAKLMTEEPRPLGTLRRSASRAVEATIHHALEKLPADRFATARAFADALEGKATVPVSRAAFAAPASRTLKIALLVASAVALVAAAVAAGLWGVMDSGAASVQTAHMTLVLDDSLALRSGAGVRLALSPDGSQLVYVGGTPVERLYLRRLDDLSPKAIPGTEGAINPQFSPDGKWIAFAQDLSLKKIPVSGGASVLVADSVSRFAWGEGDLMVISKAGALWRMSAAGGHAEPLTQRDSTRPSLTWPHVLPGGKAVLISVGPGGDSSNVAVLRLDDRTVTPLALRGVNPRYLASGHLVFARADGTIMAAPFDVRRLRVTGAAVPVLEGVNVRGGGAAEFTVSRNGTLVYMPASGVGEELVEVDRGGRARILLPRAQPYGYPRFSPDGRRIALSVGKTGTDVSMMFTSFDIWIYDFASSTFSPLTNDGSSSAPAWSASGRRLAWTYEGGARREVRWRPWDASGPVETLLADTHGVQLSQLGDSFLTGGAATLAEPAPVQLVSLDSARSRTIIPDLPARVATPRLSPDGRWIAYSTGVADREEVFVQAVRGPGGRYQISANGGREPVWAPSGKEIFFRPPNAGKGLLAATIATSPEFTIVRRDTVFAMDAAAGRFAANYDVSPDGRRFVFPMPAPGARPPVVVFGWFNEVRARMALTSKK